MPSTPMAPHGNDPWFVHFSNLLGSAVLQPDGKSAGKLVDMVVHTGEPYPPVERLVLRAEGRRRVHLPWSDVVEVRPDALRVREGVVPSPGDPPLGPDRLSLRKEILDRQIVDVEGAKLVRVNDLQFLVAKGGLRLAHVDVGFRGLVRRMGWERAVDRAVTSVRPSSQYLRSDSLLSWKLVQPLDTAPGKVRLEVAQRALGGMHPADLAEIMEDLDRDQRAVLLERLDVETAADTLEETSPEVTAQILEEVAPERAADILEEMAPDQAADALGELSGETRRELLAAMEHPEAHEVQRLLHHDPRSAGGLMTPDRVQLQPRQTVADALAELRRRAEDLPLVYEIFLTDRSGVLVGLCTLRDLLLAPVTARLGTIAREPPVTVEVDATLRDVADAAAKYNLVSVPVVDSQGALVGMVTIDDILSEVLDGR